MSTLLYSVKNRKDINSLKINELRQLASHLGLDVSGSKEDLQKRIAKEMGFKESYKPVPILEELKAPILAWTGEEEEVSEGLCIQNDTLINEIRKYDPSFSLTSYLRMLKEKARRLNDLKKTFAWKVYQIIKDAELWDIVGLPALEDGTITFVVGDEDGTIGMELYNFLKKYSPNIGYEKRGGDEEPVVIEISNFYYKPAEYLTNEIQEIYHMMGGDRMNYYNISHM